MDCLTAQELVSAAMDREPVDASLLAQAKEHCRTCPDCAVFVRAQLAAKQATLPVPPPDLADRVMAAIRAEAASQAQTAPAQPETARAAAPGTEERITPKLAVPIASLAPPKPRTRRKLSPRMVIGLASAATVFAALGIGALIVYGGRQMASNSAMLASSPSTTATSKNEARLFDYMPTPQNAPQSTGGNAAAPSAAAPNAAGVAAAGPRDITVNGVVYTLVGPSDTSLGSMGVLGSTSSALGSTKAPADRRVYAGLDPNTVYTVDDSGTALSFARATRSYLGQTYVLTSTELTGFGQWPALPSQFGVPKADDGSPTFTYDGTDAAGVKVYRLANSSATNGIAVAPKTDSSGPAAGDPNWTWWAIQH